MQLSGLLLLACFAVGLTACSEEQPAYNEHQRVCISQRYNHYDPKQLTQCLDVCKNCLNGSVVTNNTTNKHKNTT